MIVMKTKMRTVLILLIMRSTLCLLDNQYPGDAPLKYMKTNGIPSDYIPLFTLLDYDIEMKTKGGQSMYRHKKPRNLYIASYEGIDTAGKTTAFQTLKRRIIEQGYAQQISKASLIQLNELYETPLQLEGTALFEDYNAFLVLNMQRNLPFLDGEIEALEQDFYISKQVDCVVKLFMTLPNKGVPSYSKIEKIFKCDKDAPKRQEHRFRAFVDNYHESMESVWNYIKNKPKQYHNPTVYLLYTDRSWVSNLVYNGYTGDIENTDALLNKIKQARYHTIDLLTLFIIDKATLQDRMQGRLELSSYERYGVDYLMKLQEKYLYLVTQLHKLNYIKEFAVVNHATPDLLNQLNQLNQKINC